MTVTEIRITPTAAADWASRLMAETAEVENGPNPYAKIPFAGGVVELDADELQEVLSDATYQADPYGPGEFKTASERRSWRTVADRAVDALDRLGVPAWMSWA